MATIWFERIKELCDNYGTNPEALAKSLGMSASTIRKWDSSAPSIDKVKAVADYFNVSTDYLIGLTDIPITAERLASDDAFIQAIREQEATIRKATTQLPRFTIEALRLAARWQNLDVGGKRTTLAVLDAEEERLRASEIPKAQKSIPLFGNSFAAGIGEPDFGNALEEFVVDADTKADFAVRVNGESMEPYLHDGQIALGVKGPPKIGDIVAIMVDGAFYVKQFATDNFHNLYLLSLNRQYPDIQVYSSSNSTVRCFGVIQMNQKIPLAN